MYEDVVYFTPENIYEQINGRAEFYLAYDMVGMFFASYEYTLDSRHFVELSVFDMGTPTNAFGAFSAQRSVGSPGTGLGRASYQTGAHQYVWAGQYYMQVIASDTTALVRDIAFEMAGKSARALHDTGEPVWGLTALPEDGLIPGSEQYFLVDAMGLDFLQNTYMARYISDGAEVAVFVSRMESPDAATRAVARFHDHASKYGDTVDRLTQTGYDLVVADMGGAYDVFTDRGRLVVGAYGVENRDLAMRTAIDLANTIRQD
jgi:hypothetical protein